MKTLLDEFYASFLHSVFYDAGELRITVAEGFRAAEPEDLVIGEEVINDTYALKVSEESRVVEVRFNQPIAWQLVDESFTSGDDYEVHENTFKLQVLTKSRYFDYVRANHGWFEDTRGSGKHYRVWTENEVVDVVGCEPPTVRLTTLDRT